MLNFFAKFLLVATSFAPVLLTYAVAIYSRDGATRIVYILCAATILAVFMCMAVIYAAGKYLERQPFPVQSVKSADREIVSFVLSYLLPLIPATGTKVTVPVLVAAAIVLFVVIYTSNSYHFNPLLGLFGYRFYEVQTESGITFVLISRRQLRSSRSVSRVVELTDYMVLDMEK
ncbi:MAG: hypothetical protein AB1941_18770 [Gemmatimonadota bacterium]